MSGKVAMQVLESGLPEHLKLTAVTLALFGDDDGARVFPSVPRVAYLVGKTARQVRSDLSALIAAQVLLPLTPRTGGRGYSTLYRLNLDALPARPPWIPHRKPGCPLPPLEHKPGSALPPLDPEKAEVVTQKAEVCDTKGGSGEPERRKPTSEKAEAHFRRSVSDSLGDPPENQYSAADGALLTPTTPDDDDDDDDDDPWRGERTRQPADDGNFRVIVKLAHQQMEVTGISDPESPDLVEDTKCACARLKIAYDSGLVRRALHLASLQRKFARGGPSLGLMAAAVKAAPDADTMGLTLKAIADAPTPSRKVSR